MKKSKAQQQKKADARVEGASTTAVVHGGEVEHSQEKNGEQTEQEEQEE